MSGNQEADGSTAENGPSPTTDLYREKPPSTVVRVMTVLAYLTSVSFAAILLSVYYICVWKSPVSQETNEMFSLRRGDISEYDPAAAYNSSPYNFTGGSNNSVNTTATPLNLEDFTTSTYTNDNETADTTMDYIENSNVTKLNEIETSTDVDALNVTTVT